MKQKTKKRVLYMIPHTTLVEFECNLLKDLGFEIYLPKSTGKLRSCSINYEFDTTLSIPKNIIDYSNQWDFFGEEIPSEIFNFANKYFDAVIVPNIYPLAYSFAKHFQGTFILRAFGYEKDTTYESTTQNVERIHGIKKFFKPKEIIYDNEMTRLLYKKRNKFILGCAYKEIIENETPFFKRHAIYLPLGIGESIWKNEKSWNGNINKIMFVCPSIHLPYYREIYNLFKQNFSEIPHSIFGAQKKQYEDPNIIGYLERDDYDTALQNYKVMFYHSQEPRHLHYHPLEAIIFGMPLIYMTGGILEKCGGKDQPGMCNTYKEAKDKITRILNNDTAFINMIKEKQNKILNDFIYENVKQIWEKNFMPLVK